MTTTVVAGPYTWKHAEHQDPADGLPTCRGDKCQGITVGCSLGAIVCNRHRDRLAKSAVRGYAYPDPFGPAAKDDTPARIEPAYLRTPDLVEEYARARARASRGVVSTSAAHKRHCAVVDELRYRGILDQR